nr:protein FAM172A [Cavia porcellus]
MQSLEESDSITSSLSKWETVDAPGPLSSAPSGSTGTNSEATPRPFPGCRSRRRRVRNDVSVSRRPRKCNSNLAGARIPRGKVLTTALGSSTSELEGHASSRLSPQPCSWGQSSDLLSRIDLDELMKKDEPPLDFPDTLEGFEYAFNEKGQLRHIKTGEPFVFNYREDLHRWNQKRYEALGEIITKYVYELLEKDCNLKKITIPVDATENEPKSFIFMSEDALTNPQKLMVLIHGSGVVRAGQWARRLIINEDLDSGTQIPFIKRAVHARGRAETLWHMSVLEGSCSVHSSQEAQVGDGRRPERTYTLEELTLCCTSSSKASGDTISWKLGVAFMAFGGHFRSKPYQWEFADPEPTDMDSFNYTFHFLDVRGVAERDGRYVLKKG